MAPNAYQPFHRPCRNGPERVSPRLFEGRGACERRRCVGRATRSIGMVYKCPDEITEARRCSAISGDAIMRKKLRDNSLTLAMFGLFVLCLLGHSVAGHYDYNDDQHAHQQSPLRYTAYLTSGHFWATVFENWESEFLQMAAYVILTVFLFQKGSSESKKPDESNPEDESPSAHRGDPDAPGPVHRGGLLLKLYSHSLSIALVTLFLASFCLHLAGSTRRMNEEAFQHHQPPQTMTDTLVDPQFWYESFQNWQSEFLSIAVLLVLGIYLRERGSPESKPVAAPHAATGHGAFDLGLGSERVTPQRQP